MKRYQIFANAVDGAPIYYGSRNNLNDVPNRDNLLVIDLDTFGIYEVENGQWICIDTME